MQMKIHDIEWKWAELPVDEALIIAVQKELGVDLPVDFLNLVRESNGGYPSIKYFDFPSRGEAILNHLLSFTENGDDPSLLETYRNVLNRLPVKIIPFASDPFGNLICFDYKENPPSVCFWDHEIASSDINSSISPICDNFLKFLAKLR
jgi:hypothetical protein